MRGIDIYQGDAASGTILKAVPAKAYKESDFVIIKATQGVSYKHTSFFTAMAKKAVKDGMLIGAYHYAAGGDPKKEADYFIDVVGSYVGKAVLALDWERTQNKSWGSRTWCKAFIDRVKEKTGVTCMIYVNNEGLKHVDNLCGRVPLWFAGFPTDANSWTVPKFKYNLGKWKDYAIWQFTSSGEKVDRNTTDLTSLQWRAMAASSDITPDRLVMLLSVYHAYIAAHAKYFINHYDPKMTNFPLAKQCVAIKKEVGLTCVVPLRWALYEMDIENGDGKCLISAPGGSFEKCYTGEVKTYFKRYTSTGAIGKTAKQVIDAGQLKAGDIICFENLTHVAVYSGTGYIFFGGGGECVKDGHYPNGIRLDYSTFPNYKNRKIAEVLRMRTASKEKTVTKATASNVTATSLRKKVVNALDMLLGVKEGSAEHKMIIDTFNKSGLCTRYKMTTKDAWCATAVSFAFIVTKLAGKPGSGALFQCVECSCTRMIDLAKKQGIWVEDDSHVPKVGDVIMYDWQDSGKGDDKGTPEHTGIVKSVSNNKMVIIEGNYKNSVSERSLPVNSKFIRGFICPKYGLYASEDKQVTSVTQKPKLSEKSTKKGYSGRFPYLPPRGYYKYGDGYLQYRAFATQVKRVQKLINWIVGSSLAIDGDYGNKTIEAVKKAQTIIGEKPDGLFGADTLAKARAYKK